MNRGDVYAAPIPGGWRPAVIVTRDRAIPFLANVCVATITSTVRELPTEVPVGPAHGLADECVVNCDNLYTVPKRSLGARRGALGPTEVARLDAGLRIALGLDEPRNA